MVSESQLLVIFESRRRDDDGDAGAGYVVVQVDGAGYEHHQRRVYCK